MGDFEAIGDAVTGGLLARAVEPGAGEARGDGHTHEKDCLNCGTRLSGAYCFNCGQKAHVHRSVRGFFQDFIAGLFNFEGKFWRTLPMLVWHPGEMTRRYIAGERARFISPIALYLFTVFAMFAALSFSGTFSSEGLAVDARAALQESIKDDQRSLARLEAERKTGAATGDELKSIDRRIARRKNDIAEAQQALAELYGKTRRLSRADSLYRSALRQWEVSGREDAAEHQQKIRDALALLSREPS